MRLRTCTERSRASVDKYGTPCGYDGSSGEVKHHHAEQDMCFAKRIALDGKGGVFGGMGRRRHSE